MMHGLLTTVFTVFYLMLTASSVFAQPSKGLTDLIREQLLQAYQQTQTYQAMVEIKISQKAGRIRQTMDCLIAYDRSANRLRVDRSDTLLVRDGSKLFFKADQLPGHHLEMVSPSRLDYQALESIGPILGNTDLPDLAFLLAMDPWAVIGEGRLVAFALATPQTESSAQILELTLADG